MVETKSVGYYTLVEFKVSTDRYFLEMSEVKEIQVPDMNIVPVPLSGKHVVGIIDVRGEIFTIVSLKHVLHPEETEKFHIDSDSRIVLLEYKALNLGFLVDSVESIKKFPSSIFENQSSIIETHIDWKFIKTIGVEGKNTFIILDLDSVFTQLGEFHDVVNIAKYDRTICSRGI